MIRDLIFLQNCINKNDSKTTFFIKTTIYFEIAFSLLFLLFGEMYSFL